MGVTALRAEPFGESALLIWCGRGAAAQVAEQARARWPQARDVVPAADSVLIEGISDLVGAIAEIETWPLAPRASVAHRLVELETRYDGPDLAEVARVWSVTPDEVVELHAAAQFQVAFCGFSPGFAYCTGLAPQYAVPRRSNPRPRVDAGSVGLADIYTGVYPTASPGGWQLIGRTEASLWDLSRDEPALLVPGTTVRFVPR